MDNDYVFRVGDIVVFDDEIAHQRFPQYYPCCGTTGRVVVSNPHAYFPLHVQWEKGSTSSSDIWGCKLFQIIRPKPLEFDPKNIADFLGLKCS